jgi:hypothetical protein
MTRDIKKLVRACSGETSGVITMTFTGGENSKPVFQYEGDTPDDFLPQMEEILTSLCERGIVSPRKRNGEK